mgnify:FL=1
MGHLLKLFDHTKDEKSSHSTSTNGQKLKKTIQTNGIYRTIRLTKSNSDPNNIQTSLSPSDDLRIYDSKPKTKVKDIVDSFNTLKMNNENDYLDRSNLLSRKNSDIVFYKRITQSRLNSNAEIKMMPEDDDDDEDDDEILVDVLPSFQFYDSIVKFLPDDKDEDLDNCDIEDNILLEPLAVGEETTDVLNPPEYNSLTAVNFTPQASHQSVNSENQHDGLRFEVDKIHELPKRLYPGLDIRITLTKNTVKPNTPLEKEISLREFSSGELISGYFVLTNRTDTKIKFDGFYVSFEGSVQVRNSSTHRVTKMKILKTHDLSATWSYSHVEMSSGVGYRPGGVDEVDKSRLGLPNDKVIEPKTTYKKYFCFKIPSEILDINCKHQIPQHLALPPTFGYDVTDKNNSNLECNPLLGYGLNGIRGSAVICPDLALYGSEVSAELKKHVSSSHGHYLKSLRAGFDNEYSSIQYSINCRMVKKSMEHNQHYILNDTSHSIRIIPNALSSNNKYKYTEGKTSEIDINEFKKNLNNFNSNITRRCENLDILLKKLKNWDDDTFCKDDLNIQNQDIIENKQSKEISDSNLSFRNLGLQRDGPLINNSGSVADDPNKQKHEVIKEFKFDFKKKQSGSFDKLNDFFALNSQDKHVQSESFVSGIMKISTSFEKNLKVLPYHTNKSIEDYNKREKKSNINKKIWDEVVDPKLPTTKEDYILKSLPVDIELSNHGVSDYKPQIKSIKTLLVAVTAFTEKELPILVDGGVYLKEKHFLKQIVQNCKIHYKTLKENKKEYEIYKERLHKLCARFEVPLDSVRFENLISKNTQNDIDSFSTLNFEEFPIDNIFKNTNTENLQWVKKSDNTMGCKLNVNLEYKERQNMVILPSFDNCIISRFYYLKIDIRFDHCEKMELKVPIDVRYV